jgi:hypothetical protein
MIQLIGVSRRYGRGPFVVAGVDVYLHAGGLSGTSSPNETGGDHAGRDKPRDNEAVSAGDSEAGRNEARGNEAIAAAARSHGVGGGHARTGTGMVAVTLRCADPGRAAQRLTGFGTVRAAAWRTRPPISCAPTLSAASVPVRPPSRVAVQRRPQTTAAAVDRHRAGALPGVVLARRDRRQHRGPGAASGHARRGRRARPYRRRCVGDVPVRRRRALRPRRVLADAVHRIRLHRAGRCGRGVRARRGRRHRHGYQPAVHRPVIHGGGWRVVGGGGVLFLAATQTWLPPVGLTIREVGRGSTTTWRHRPWSASPWPRRPPSSCTNRR